MGMQANSKHYIPRTRSSQWTDGSATHHRHISGMSGGFAGNAAAPPPYSSECTPTADLVPHVQPSR
ncbi:hypothetical protein ACJQWK_03233 [Exserohilum turcicum]